MDFNARIYNPSLGRFMGADALASVSAASSPYAFTSNDPINLIDPTGLTSREWAEPHRKHYQENLSYEVNYLARLWGWGRRGPGSGYHWSDGIGYSDWTLSGGSPTYQRGLSMGLIEFGGRLYRVNADGSRNEFDTRHGQIGFWEDRTFSTIDEIEINGKTYSGPSVGVTPVFVPISLEVSYITGEWQQRPEATITSVNEGDGRFKIRVNPGGKVGIGIAEKDYNVTGIVGAKILAKRYVNGNLVEQRVIGQVLSYSGSITTQAKPFQRTSNQRVGFERRTMFYWLNQ